ncbi:Putative uncharacterized protein OS=uncultured planctomycete GN=HGMM_F11G08C26 PE=4 SV=1 [Gemmata massiliana]|uniref:Uncharacterized protein n=1 Tax=Gemmata massiliana TaxID=1210884 RepID=A0A6P2CXR8_9BACT|nr:hypothetical protein [Gemmata massiliana]VTR92584.1 Putative uncharacterized protein OS=uncultured planctomycete GN=HGMM_F11G08C26 PE=4 SV=1 [Gemmata massiliana]
MAKGRKSRMDLRREAEAIEAKQREEETEGEETEDEDEEEEDSDTEGEAEAEGEGDGDSDSEGDSGDDEGDSDDDERPKKKKKAKKVAVKKAPTKRSRTAKEVRTRAVWIVFDNGSKVVEKFPYNQKEEAEALLAKKLEEKKTFYLNLVKEEIKE